MNFSDLEIVGRNVLKHMNFHSVAGRRKREKKKIIGVRWGLHIRLQQ